MIHSLPEGVNRFLGGGRGGAKSEASAQDVTYTAERYGSDAKILVIRKGPYKSLQDTETTLRRVFNLAWGPRAHRLNKSTWRWSVPTGSHIELGILPDGKKGKVYYETAYQGRSFTHIIVQEAGQFATGEVIDLMRSNLRGPIPTRMTLEANPGGEGHQWLRSRFVVNRKPWHQFEIERPVVGEDGKQRMTATPWISCPSTYLDNPYLPDDYLDTLASSIAADPELLKAWVTGDWDIARGSYFAAALDNPRIKINWPEPSEWGGWPAYDWSLFLAFDHGTSNPAVCYVMAKSPGALGPDGIYYPANSILMLDEWACHRQGDLTQSFGWGVPQIAGEVLSLARRWGIPASGVADDACFSSHGHTDDRGNAMTIADAYAAEGVHWSPARKGGRAARFLKMKGMLSACGDLERAGLYVSERCHYWWETVPTIIHDPKNGEVPLKGGADHGLDASSYGLEGRSAGGFIVKGRR